jgi:hypothetical protein
MFHGMTARGTPSTTVTEPLMYLLPTAGLVSWPWSDHGPTAVGAVRCRHEQHVKRWYVPLKRNGPFTSPAPVALKGCNGIAEPGTGGGRGGGGGAGLVLVMLQIVGQSVHSQLEPQWMALQATLSLERLPLPWHTAQLGGQPGHTQPPAHLSVLQHGGVNAMLSELACSASSSAIVW